jgi:hypothetical protein
MDHPGPWQLFVKRQDIRSLHILRQKEEYILEESIYERRRQMGIMINAQHGGGPSPIEPSTNISTNNYVDDDYIDDYFI